MVFCYAPDKLRKAANRNNLAYGFFSKKSLSDSLRDLVPFVQFKKREKHPWRSVTFRWVFFTFFKCTNGTKSCNTSQMFLTHDQNYHRDKKSKCFYHLFLWYSIIFVFLRLCLFYFFWYYDLFIEYCNYWFAGDKCF